MTTAFLLAILAIAWVALLFLVFRAPGSPAPTRLILFQLLLLVTCVLGYFFLVEVVGFNPNPIRVRIARTMTDDKMIYLGDFVPGVYDLDYLYRIDTDGDQEEPKEEWLATYQYDVSTSEGGSRQGPFGAAIYDLDDCRPPAVLSFELVPVSYDYLAQDAIIILGDAKTDDVVVKNIIPHADPLSVKDGVALDRPEVIVFGRTRGARTDLNVFRKVGVELDCFARQQWVRTHPGQPFPNPLRYENVGSFRGNYGVSMAESTVTVLDRAPFERSQIVIRRQYRPVDGSYFRFGTQTLRDPVEYTLAFGPGQPDVVQKVYYPEKAVLAFYANLTKDRGQLETAQGYLSEQARGAYDLYRDPFGLSTDPESVAKARDKLARVLVWEIRYQPDVPAEQLHQEREVTVTVVGVDKDGNIDYDHPCQVNWRIIGAPNPQALPYGCEWRLDSYTSTCQP
jgi:hypothetical protein